MEDIKKIINEMLDSVARDEYSQRQNDYCDGYEFALNELKKKLDLSYNTIDEYRGRLIQAFQNADCASLIALVALPTEKEFQHLEWLLKEHYKKYTLN